MSCPVYVVAAKLPAPGFPKGACLRCGEPLAEHEHQVSPLVARWPNLVGYVIDPEVFGAPIFEDTRA